jgi:Na+/H+-translocating membrane pyrophosphatase
MDVDPEFHISFLAVSTYELNFTTCKEYWVCTDWTVNGTFEYRTCQDLHVCGTTALMPSENIVNGAFFLAIIIMISSVLGCIFLSSQKLDDTHWPLKMGLFYGSLALGWCLLGTVLSMVALVSGGTTLEKSLTTAYFAFTVVGIVCLIYIAVTMFSFALTKLLNTSKLKEHESSGEDEAW